MLPVNINANPKIQQHVVTVKQINNVKEWNQSHVYGMPMKKYAPTQMNLIIIVVHILLNHPEIKEPVWMSKFKVKCVFSKMNHVFSLFNKKMRIIVWIPSTKLPAYNKL